MEVTCGLTARLNERFPSASGLQKELLQQSVLGDGAEQELLQLLGTLQSVEKHALKRGSICKHGKPSSGPQNPCEK